MTTPCYLRTPAAIRERAEKMLTYVEDGKSPWFALDGDGLEAAVAGDARGDSAALPQSVRHSLPFALAAFRGGRPRPLGGARRTPEGIAEEEIARRRMDLAVVSVLLDAGAGPAWSYREPGTGETYARSEGLGVASFHMFANGAFSRDAKGDPLRVDAERLAALDAGRHRHGLPGARPQSADRPRRPRRTFAQAGRRRPRSARRAVRHRGRPAATVKAASILAAVLDKLSPIWPLPMGDVWPHPAIGLVPFHKLSQWLSYSLVEPLEGRA